MLGKNLIEGTRHKVWQVMYQNRAMRNPFSPKSKYNPDAK